MRSAIIKAVAATFKALGDIPRSVTYRRTNNSYSPSTGVNTVTNTDTTITDAITIRFDKTEIDKISILATDLKAIVQQSRLSITPQIATDVFIIDSKTYNIIRLTKDPVNAVYIFQLRAP